MVSCIRVPLQEAQQAKTYLIEHDWLATDYTPLKEENVIYFPVQGNYTGQWVVGEKELLKREVQQAVIPFKEALAKVLSEEEMNIVKTAHDIMGSVAIIEIPKELEAKEKIIAQTLLDSNPFIKTILKKEGGHEGSFRTQHMKFLAGEETKTAEYKENNCTFVVDVEDVYFSPRLSTERKRISELVKEGENILVMFSGAAPYPCVLAKNTLAKEIIGVEINPKGHEQGLANLKRNKISNVELHCGDVREVVPTLNKTFNRIIMPLPKTAEEFLDVALPVATQGCVIHLYGFYHEEEFDKAQQEIDKYKVAGRTYEILSVNKVGQQSPRTYRICVDFQLTN